MARCALALLAAFTLTAASAAADTTVVLSKTHLCCGRCVTAVNAVLKEAGVTGAANQKEKNVTFTAADDAKAQAVIDALAAAGFHGEVNSKTLKVKDDSGVKPGKVSALKLTGLHNCCGSCNVAIKKALKSVDGVQSDDAQADQDTVTVTGDFDAQAVVKALFDAGFHAKAAK